MDPTAAEIRVLGCLIEKQRTTPDAYPLSLNSLRLACNQSTNRDPVVAYEEAEVREAAQALSRRGWARLASRGGRTVKYRHLFDEALGLDDGEISLLAVLMLRGPQTPGELKARSERLHAFADLDAVHDWLEALIAAGHVREIGRRPGQKEARFEQALGGAEGGSAEPREAPAAPEPSGPVEGDRLASLERELAELRAELEHLRAELRKSRPGGE